MSAKNPAAVTMGRLGGKAKTPAKAAASRENGKKGGRPRKCKRVVIEYIKSVDVTFVSFLERQPRQRYLAAQFAGKREKYATDWANRNGYTVAQA